MAKTPISRYILQTLLQKQAFSDIELRDKIYAVLVYNGIKQENINPMISRALKSLLISEHIESFPYHGKTIIRLTKLGKQKLHIDQLSLSSGLVSRIWDGKWRMIILDFPESKKSERESLRYLLQKSGFYMLKNSIWVSPYQHEFFYTNLKQDLGLTSELVVCAAAEFDYETESLLRKFFGISN